MAGRILAGSLALTGDWALGENGWKDENDVNLLKLSVLVQGRALELVDATPGAPTEGDVYLFSDVHPTQAGKIGVYDEAAWAYLTPQIGWRMWDADAGFLREYEGTTWIEVTSGGGSGVPDGGNTGDVLTKRSAADGDADWEAPSGGIPEAPEDGGVYGRKDGNWSQIISANNRVVAKAKVLFSGAGAISLEGAENVDSVTRTGDGCYTVEFTENIPAGCVMLGNGRFGDNALTREAILLGISRITDEGITTTHAHLVVHAAVIETALFDPYESGRPNSWIYFEIIDPNEPATRPVSSGVSSVQTEAGNYTVVPGDMGNYIRLTSAAAKNITIEADATTALPTNGEWHFRNAGAGDATVDPSGGVTVNAPAGGSLVVSEGGVVTLKRVGVDEFDLIGQTVPA